MGNLVSLYQRMVALASSRWIESIALLITRLALAGIFWRSGRTKVVEGSWLQVSDTTQFLFESEYAGVPIPANIAAPMALYAETLFPILLVLGLATRMSAAALLGMTLVIQLFVYPDAWWSVHIAWVAMASILVVRGGGILALDTPIAARYAQ